MSRFGTIEWGERRGGELTTADRLRYLGRGVVSQLAALRSRLIAPEALAGVELPERPPDSRLAREAEERCREVSSESLFNHCLRVYLWGALLGQRERLGYDDELLFVGSALHDLSLTDTYAGKLEGVNCFAVEGGMHARAWALEHGCEAERARRVANAISLHVNPRVSVREGAEEHLVGAGAAYDVIGARYRELAPPLVSAVIDRYPRLGFKREIDELTRAAARRHPRSRPALAYRVGFGGMVAGAPFAD